MTIPIERVARAITHWLHGIPDDEPARCFGCGINVQAGEGFRADRVAYCTADCADAYADAAAI